MEISFLYHYIFIYFQQKLRKNYFKKMKITDLNIDCLEAILDRLKFQDFVNAADSNKRIKHAAEFLFLRKYNEKKATLSC